MTSVGADYSSKAVYLASVSDKIVLRTSTIEIQNNNIELFLRELEDELRNFHWMHNNKYIWIEQPWVETLLRPMSGLQLARMATYIEVVAIRMARLIPQFVHPGTWRKEIYGNGRPKDAKELARQFVDDKFNFKTKYKYEHNICEAILISHYGNLQAEKLIINK